MCLFCDNELTINIANNLVQYSWTKHIEIDRYFIKEKLKSYLICTLYMPTNSQLSIVLTKDSSNLAFQSLIDKLEMDDIYSGLKGNIKKIVNYVKVYEDKLYPL